MILRNEVLQLARRCTGTLTYVIISALGAHTDANLTRFEGMCAAVLLFVVVEVLVDSFFTSGTAKSTMLKQVCLLYCTQRARTLFSSESETMPGFLSNLFLAIILALSLIFILDTTPSTTQRGMCGDELRGALQGLVYMYADMFDFAFRYGVFKVTLFSFVAGMFFDRLKSSDDKITVFTILLFKVICTNLTSQGFDLLITSTPQLELFECLLAVAVLRLAMPSMGSYLVYLASVRVAVLVPGVEVLLLCALLWLDLLVPPSQRPWVGELCMAYIAGGLANLLLAIPVAGALVLLIMVHYADLLLMVHCRGG